MVSKLEPKHEIGSQYNINHKSWRLAEVTSRNTYVLQYEDAGGTYHTMRLTESEMDNVVKTKRLYDT
jgi:hypothetical protein